MFRAAMFTVGCAGFAVPATRYFKENFFVEIQETNLATPGPGTIRRWRREAPDGFEFALLGPREIIQEGFKPGKIVDAALEALAGVRDSLDAKRAVFIASSEFAPNKANRAALKAFLTLVRPQYEKVAFDVPAWKPDDADLLAEDTDTLAMRDPLNQGLSKRPEAYYRLPGPAGRKSRYEDPAIEELADIAMSMPEQKAHYIFANVDMFSDAKRFRKVLDDYGKF